MVEPKDIGDGAWFAYQQAWLAPEEADLLLAELLAVVAWEQRAIHAYGQEIQQPRLMGWGGELPYRYSGLTLEPRPLVGPLEAMRARVSADVGIPFNHVVLNRYRDGRDHVAMHADDEPELGRNPVIAGISLGARRRFVMSPKRRRGWKRTWKLTHGSLFVMGGSCQHTWYHAVPREARLGFERINLTFRLLYGPPGWRDPSLPPRREPVVQRSEPRTPTEE